MLIPKKLAVAAAKLSEGLSRWGGNVELRRDAEIGEPEMRVTDGRSLVVAKWSEPMKTSLASRIEEDAKIDLGETVGFHARVNGGELAKAAKLVKSSKSQERVQPVAGMLCLQERDVAESRDGEDDATAFDVALHNGEALASCRVSGSSRFPNTEPILADQEKPEAVFCLSVAQLERTLAVMKSAIDAPADKLYVTFGAVGHDKAVQLHVSAEENTTGQSFGLIMPLSADSRGPQSPLDAFGKFASTEPAAEPEAAEPEAAEPEAASAIDSAVGEAAEVTEPEAETDLPEGAVKTSTGWKFSPASCFV